MSGYQPPIGEFAALLENVGLAMTRIAEMAAGKAFTTVDVEISRRTVSLQPSS